MRSAQLIWSLLILVACQPKPSTIPDGFVDVSEAIPEVAIELRYYSTNNFIGDTITAYEANKLILSKEAAVALSLAQQSLAEQGLGLKLFDGYRPQPAVDHFVTWAKDLSDTLMKQHYYPQVAKNRLFDEGYIAARSGHSRGSTIDLTIIDLESTEELDMGSSFDLFDSISHHDAIGITPQQQANRELLKRTMIEAGFRPYSKEWWHYTLNDEPYPDTYFDFAIR